MEVGNKKERIQSFGEFYYYYLTEHSNTISRSLHFIGTGLVIAMFITALVLQKWILLALIPVAGYGFAWFGHAFFEKNKPATFKYPLWSLGSDFIMFWHILSGQINDKMTEAKKRY
jgi:hypothetical protein